MQVCCVSVSEHVWVRGSMPGGGGGKGVASYQPGVYVPLKALFLVFIVKLFITQNSFILWLYFAL